MNQSWEPLSPDPEVLAAQFDAAVRRSSNRRTGKRRKNTGFLDQPDCFLGESGAGFAFGWDLGRCRRQFSRVLDDISPGFQWVDVKPTGDRMLQATGTSCRGVRRIATLDIDDFAVVARITNPEASWCVSVCVVDRFLLTKRSEMLAVFASANFDSLGLGLSDGSLLPLPVHENDPDRLVANLILMLAASPSGLVENWRSVGSGVVSP